MTVLRGVARLRRYERAWLRGDVLAGVTVAAYLVPQVMAYAALAGLPPVAGLWTMIPAIVAYTLFGSSGRLSVGPESTTAVMTAVVIGPLAQGDSGRYAGLAAALALLVGLFAVAARLLRLGFVADMLSQPILVGYLTGVAFVMIVGQLEKVSGVPVDGDKIFGEMVSFVRGLGDLEWRTLAVAGACLVFLFLVERFWPRLPGPLLAVLLATAVVALFGLDGHGVRVVGSIPSGLPVPKLPELDSVTDLLLPALGVLLVGYTDNMLTARAFEARGGDGIDGNAELLALGAANIGSGLMQGFPVSSSGSRTALGAAAGSRTQVFSLAALVGVLAVLLVLNPLLTLFPSAALGAIVIFAAVRLIDLAAFGKLAAFRRTELYLALTATAGVLVFDILYGILIAIGLSVLDLLARVARPHDAVLGHVPGLAGMHDVDDYPQAKTIAGLVVYRYDSPLFFANAEDFKRRALTAVDSHAGEVRWFVLNTEANVEVDSTALAAVEDLCDELASRGIVVAMARVKQDLRDDLQRYGLIDKIGADRIFPTLPTAVAAFHTAVSGHPGTGG